MVQRRLLVQGIKWSGESSGFSTVSVNALVTITTSLSLVSNVLIADTPQLLISFLYLFYNNFFSCMLLSTEYTRYASKRKYPARLGTRGPAVGDVLPAATIPICSAHTCDDLDFALADVAVVVPSACGNLRPADSLRAAAGTADQRLWAIARGAGAGPGGGWDHGRRTVGIRAQAL